MIKYDGKFEFNDAYRDLSTMTLSEPSVMKSTLGEIIPMNKVVAKEINYNAGMRSLQFSKNLYETDSTLWKTLRTKKSKLESVKEYFSSNKVMIIDDEIVSVVNNDNYLSDFMSIISNLTKNKDLKFFYNYTNQEFQFMVLKNSDTNIMTGFIIRYYLSYNWISVMNVRYDSSTTDLFVSPFMITDKAIEDDLEIILDTSVLLDQCDIIDNEYTNFINKSSVKMSYAELFSNLKSDFGIKITYKVIDPIDYLANTEYSELVSKFLNKVLTSIYNGAGYQYVNSSYLKKLVNFSDITYGEYYKAVSDMYFDGSINIDNILSIARSVINSRTNYDQLN